MIENLLKLTIVMWRTGITFVVLKKVVQKSNHTTAFSSSVATIATIASIIITTTTITTR